MSANQLRQRLAAATASRDAAGGRQAPVWVAPVYAAAAVLLLPWIVVLVFALPSTETAAHWDVAWAGFDVMLAVLLLTVAITAWRRSPWLEGAATASATLLFVDAWFDILTSSTTADLVAALIEAVVVELPLAAVCLLIARRAESRMRSPRVAAVPQRSEIESSAHPAQRAA